MIKIEYIPGKFVAIYGDRAVELPIGFMRLSECQPTAEALNKLIWPSKVERRYRRTCVYCQRQYWQDYGSVDSLCPICELFFVVTPDGIKAKAAARLNGFSREFTELYTEALRRARGSATSGETEGTAKGVDISADKEKQSVSDPSG